MPRLDLFVAASLALCAISGTPVAAGVPNDDVFTGTLTVENGKPVLTRCDAASNRYALIDERVAKSPPLANYADSNGHVFDVVGTAEDKDGGTTLTVHAMTVRKPRPICHLSEIDAMFTAAAERPPQPAAPRDLVALLECRSDAATVTRVRDWLRLKPAVLATAGLIKVPTRKFSAEYRMARPISVFGHMTTTLALHPDGFLAVFGDVKPQALAQRLGAKTMLAANPFIAQKIIEPAVEPDAASGSIATRVLVVTTREGLPGKTVAGCLYLSNTREEL